MAQQVISDLIMKFEVTPNSYVEGESRTELNLRKCPMSTGFKQGSMFEVQSFTIKTGLDPEDEDAKREKAERKANKRARAIQEHQAKMHEFVGMPGKPPSSTDASDKPSKSASFQKWRAGQDVPPLAPYSVDMQPFEFTRAIDKASAVLLQKCIDREVFESATLIKRKAAGGASAGEIFLRIDFTKVLITKIDWDNDDPIKEKCQFVTRAVTIHYLPQLPDGSLGAAKQAFWTMSPKTYNPVKLRA